MSVFDIPLIDILNDFANRESWRIALTVVVLLFMPLAIRLGRHHLAGRPGTLTERGERLSIWRNTLLIIGTFIILSVWASKIAGFALSLAAVAGAVLIVSKEALMNLLGFVHLTIARPFNFGDYVEIGAARGRVVDINTMNVTLLETYEGHQVTGALVVMPNALAITQPVRNLTATGKFVVQLLRVQVDRTADVLAHEQALLAAARGVCGAWQADADTHLQRLEQHRNVDLPSADTRVVIELHDGAFADLALRYACRPNERVRVEQEILRRYLQAVRDLQPTLPRDVVRLSAAA